MREEEKLIEKYGRETGYRVPDGYFEELHLHIMTNLPPYPEAPKTVNLSLWQRVKPYVYLAAMFAGIWLMMSVFHRVSDMGTLNLDNPPAAIASAMASQDEDSMPYYTADNDYELVHEVSATYDSMDEFEEAFGYEFSPEYEAMDVSMPVAADSNPDYGVLI